MRQALGRLYARCFGRQAFVRINLLLFELSGRGLGLLNYETDRLSGEARQIRGYLQTRHQPVVFDVGANEGQWTALVLSLSPGAVLHAFEPNEQLAALTARRNPSASVNSVAVGSEQGSITLYDYADDEGSAHASVVPGVIDRIHHGTARSSTVPMTTVDAYCEDKGIDRIDYFKIDVEGHEYEVLRGAERMLARGIEVVQFEFNEMNVMSRRFLSDFIDLLGPGYDLFRLLPDGGRVRLSGGAIWHQEQFAFQNVVAIARSTVGA